MDRSNHTTNANSNQFIHSQFGVSWRSHRHVCHSISGNFNFISIFSFALVSLLSSLSHNLYLLNLSSFFFLVALFLSLFFLLIRKYSYCWIFIILSILKIAQYLKLRRHKNGSIQHNKIFMLCNQRSIFWVHDSLCS